MSVLLSSLLFLSGGLDPYQDPLAGGIHVTIGKTNGGGKIIESDGTSFGLIIPLLHGEMYEGFADHFYGVEAAAFSVELSARGKTRDATLGYGGVAYVWGASYPPQIGFYVHGIARAGALFSGEFDGANVHALVGGGLRFGYHVAQTVELGMAIDVNLVPTKPDFNGRDFSTFWLFGLHVAVYP